MQNSGFLGSLERVKREQLNTATKRSLQATDFNLSSYKQSNDKSRPISDFDSDAIVEQDSLFPNIRLVNRYCSHEDLRRAIPEHTETMTITDLYKQVSPPEFKRPSGSAPNFVIFGIVATRSATKTSARGNQFVTLLLSDLKYDISLALHGKAHEKHWKVRPGTLVALFNPQLYVQKSEHTARTLALSVSRVNCLIEIGQAKDLGQCEAMTSSSQHAKRCKNWVDVRKSRVCDFHIEQKASKSKRPEFNASSAKLWDPSERAGMNGSHRKRLAVYEGGVVPWKRGLQTDNQASFGRNQKSSSAPFGFGFADAPIGRVFQVNPAQAQARNDRKKYEESIEDKKRREARERRQLERATGDAKLISKLQNNRTPPEAAKSESREDQKSASKPLVFARSQLRKLGFLPPTSALPPASSIGQKRSVVNPVSSSQENPKDSTQQANTCSDSDSDLEII